MTESATKAQDEAEIKTQKKQAKSIDALNSD